MMVSKHQLSLSISPCDIIVELFRLLNSKLCDMVDDWTGRGFGTLEDCREREQQLRHGISRPPNPEDTLFSLTSPSCLFSGLGLARETTRA